MLKIDCNQTRQIWREHYFKWEGNQKQIDWYSKQISMIFDNKVRGERQSLRKLLMIPLSIAKCYWTHSYLSLF